MAWGGGDGDDVVGVVEREKKEEKKSAVGKKRRRRFTDVMVNEESVSKKAAKKYQLSQVRACRERPWEDGVFVGRSLDRSVVRLWHTRGRCRVLWVRSGILLKLTRGLFNLGLLLGLER